MTRSGGEVCLEGGKPVASEAGLWPGLRHCHLHGHGQKSVL